MDEKKITPKQVAVYFLRLSRPELGDILSNLKLQKLVYYAQGFHLAMLDKPLFEEDFRAWQYGPVVESLYGDYKEYSGGAVPVPDAPDSMVFNKIQQDLLNEIHEVYGKYSAWRLSEMTHEEGPWKSTNNMGVIDKMALKDYFKTQLEK